MDFDLSIDNYSYDDLIQLFKIRKYRSSPLIQKKCDFVQKNFPDGYLFFCKASKLLDCVHTSIERNELVTNDVLIDQMIERLIAIPSFDTYSVSELLVKLKPVVEQVTQVYSTPITHGKLNSIKRVTQTQNIHLHSCFRQQPSLSTDFDFILPREIKNVSSMRLASIELPNTRLLISCKQNNNSFQIKKGGQEYDIVIPDGNYTSESLEEYLRNYCEIVKFRIDDQMHSILESCTPFTFYPKGAGWIFGFRQSCYEPTECLMSEGLFDAIGDRYVYLSIEDYQYNNNSNNIVCLDKSYIDKSILAKIPTNDEKYALIIYDTDPLSKKRSYNGPVTLKKLHITLLDKFCRIIDLQQMDFSFTLELELIYENF